MISCDRIDDFQNIGQALSAHRYIHEVIDEYEFACADHGLEESGYTCSIDLDKLYYGQYAGQYPEIIKSIEADDFPLRILFNETQKAIQELEDKYSKNESAKNFLSNFR